jgi:hypothetical protein
VGFGGPDHAVDKTILESDMATNAEFTIRFFVSLLRSPELRRLQLTFLKVKRGRK